MSNQKTLIRVTVIDPYLSFNHGLYSGTECEAKELYTSTKKLKGYEVKSKKDNTNIFLRTYEIELI